MPPFYQACLIAQLSHIHWLTLQLLVELLQKDHQVIDCTQWKHHNLPMVSVETRVSIWQSRPSLV
jgi:hypothetical protein